MTAGVGREDGWSQRPDALLRRGWPILLLLALLPAARSIGALATPATIGVVLAAILVWARMIASGQSPSRAVALLSRSEERRPPGAWELSLLVFALAVCVAYLVVGSRVSEIVYNDGAYYYGVARHMAATGRFEEPILWHFLNPPDTIVHTPFDYWGCATSILLVPSLLLFGDTPRTAFVTMAVVSSASLVAFWYLVCRALPLRYHATQLLALVIFAFSPAMDVYRFQPESISVAQLFLLLSLIAFCRGHSAVALLCSFGILLTRGDGLVLFGLISAACLIQEWRGVDGRLGRVGRLVLIGLACVGTYSLWSFASFGALTPPAGRLVPFLRTYWAVFDFVAPARHPSVPLSGRFTSLYVTDQMKHAFGTLRAIPFTPAMDCWLAVALVPALGPFWRRPLREVLIWVLGIGGYVLVAWAGGPGFATVRAPYTFAPLFVLAGGLGIDAILTRLDAWVQRGESRRRAVLVGAAVLGVCSVLLFRLPVLQGYAGKATNLPLQQAELAKLDPVLQGAPVASNVPWYMIAYTRSPSVSIPFNGAAAVEAALATYPVEWMVIFSNPRSGGRSRPLLNSIRDGKTTQLGRFRFERVPVAGVKAAVFRVRTS